MQGLYPLRMNHQIKAIVNVGDDVTIAGLHISPDLDTVTYALSGLVDETKGWGISGDTFSFMEALKRLDAAPYMALGDMDLATHVYRTSRIQQGAKLEEVTTEISTRLGVRIDIIPATNDRLTSMVVVGGREVTFEEYFVRLKSEPFPEKVYFLGSASSRPPKRAVEAIRECDLLVIAPSNPVASISPILAVRGLYEEVAASQAYRIAVSPIVSGKTIKGPADKMLVSCGYEASVIGIARYYSGLIDGLVIDSVDSGLSDGVRRLGIDCFVTSTIMKDIESKVRLANDVMKFAGSHRPT